MATTDWSDNYLSAGSHLYSTHLANKISSYEELGDRICYDLGYPLINLEIHGQQLFTNIARAVEMFTKFAGYTEEFLVFDSNLYTKNKGMSIEKLLTSTPELTSSYTTTQQTVLANTNSVATLSSTTFVEAPSGQFIPLFN